MNHHHQVTITITINFPPSTITITPLYMGRVMVMVRG